MNTKTTEENRLYASAQINELIINTEKEIERLYEKSERGNITGKLFSFPEHTKIDNLKKIIKAIDAVPEDYNINPFWGFDKNQ